MALAKKDTPKTSSKSGPAPAGGAAEEQDQTVAIAEAEARSIAAASDISNLNMTSFLTAGEDTGNDGMTLDRTSFPVIVLDGSEFVDGISKQAFEMEGADLSKGFIFNIIAYKGRVSYTITPEGAKDNEGDYYVMVDAETTHTGDKIADILALAEADGATHQRKEYTDYTVVLYTKNDTEGEKPLGMASLSVPPASKGKVAGALMMYQVTKKVTVNHPSEVLLEAFVGDKINKDRISYYPWAFKVIGPRAE